MRYVTGVTWFEAGRRGHGGRIDFHPEAWIVDTHDWPVELRVERGVDGHADIARIKVVRLMAGTPGAPPQEKAVIVDLTVPVSQIVGKPRLIYSPTVEVLRSDDEG